MADNYLERRMDDFRNGRLSGSKARPVAKGSLRRDESLAGKRVVVIDGLQGIGGCVAKAFVDEGCRVAVVGGDPEEGGRLAYSMGVRFCRVDSFDAEDVERALGEVLKAWRDVDIVVDAAIGMEGACAATVSDVWTEHKRRYPIPSDYGGRLLTVSVEPFYGGDALREFGITVNSIVLPEASPHEADSDISKAVARTAIFLSRKENRPIDGSEIRIKAL